MTEAPKGLTKDEQAKFAKELAEEGIDATSPVASTPTAILTGGQPGAGKSNIKESMAAEFSGAGGIVEIDPDDVRPQLEYMRPLIATGAAEIPDVANLDAGAVAYQMIWHATAARRNILIDGTLKNTALATGLATKLHAQGYTVELHGMAVYPGLSHARTYSRREAEILNSPTGFGRKVDDAYHHEAVDGFRQTVQVFYEGHQVDRIALYDHAGQNLLDCRLQESGDWTPATPSPIAVLDQARTNPDPDALQQAARTWTAVTLSMETRGSGPDELAAAEIHRDDAIALADHARDATDVDNKQRPADASPGTSVESERAKPAKQRP